jgi:ribosomal protein S12 methylthiotransferase
METYGKSERLISSKPWTAYLKIAEGCSNNCTYCAIPLIRGENVSTPMEELIEEAKVLAKNGVKELVLIAQDSTKYGLDLYGELKLADLLEEIHKIEDLHWIRILYMYPDEIEMPLLEKMATLPKVLPYFDIPMQHASNKMLQLMNRRGRKEDVLNLISVIKDKFEMPTLRTTFIVGFPQEEEADYEEMVEFVKDVKWHRMGAFTYSPEEDTEAYEMVQDVPEALKQERLDQLMRLQHEISLENQKAYIGETIEVLIEGKDALKNMYIGRSKACAPDEVDGVIYVNSNKDIPMGSFVDVTITDALAYDLIGTAV